MFENSSTPATPNGGPAVRRAPETPSVAGSHAALVVDDEPDMVFVISHQLQRLGFAPVAAGSVREALQLLTTRTFELVVVDLLLPGPSGSELVRALRKEPRHARTAVVVASVLDDGSDSVAADARITKPFRPGQLAVAVESARRRARLREAPA